MDIDGEGRIYQNGTNYQYDYYQKDHLGSTRMVVNDQNQITEAIAYQPYGTIVPMEDIATSPQTSTRQQFTGKEFDQEGDANGAPGIQAYHFGARVYDPEIGIFLSTDPAGQYFFAYSYVGGNPILLVDPNGENAVGAIIGAVIGAYAGGAMANGSFNPGDWNWEDPGTWLGMVQGGISGASMGSSLENAAFKNYYTSTGNSPRTAYGSRVFNDLIMTDLKAMPNTMVSEMDMVDTYIGNRKLGTLDPTKVRGIGDTYTHSYGFITDANGNVVEVFSWGDNGTTVWYDASSPIGQKIRAIAQSSYDNGLAHRVGGMELDGHMIESFQKMKGSTHPWQPNNNCKHEIIRLIDDAHMNTYGTPYRGSAYDLPGWRITN